MGHVTHDATTATPQEFAFAYVSDYRTIPVWVFGIQNFTPVTEQVSGTGATFDTAVHLGPTTLRLRVEVTDWLDNSTVTLRAVKGIEGTIRWDFAAVDESTTRITATVDYRVPGGLAGRALDRIIQAFVGPAIRHTEKHLREHLDRAYAESTAGNA